ncbi:MAG TPA: PAS domain-containing protein, partial [Methanomassiliicoccales archaeon]|nr:PAS domain-containing protein [Methanomassiliicoccales archaeon]
TDIGNLDMEVRLVPITVDGKVDRLVAIARPWTPPSRDLRGMWGRFDSLRQEVLDPAGPMAGSMESCPHPALLVIHGGQLLKVNQALANELGRSMDEIMAMGNAFSFLAPFKGKDGIARRTNIEGRITIPSVLTRRDGSTQRVICYLMYVGEGDDHRVLVVISKEQ